MKNLYLLVIMPPEKISAKIREVQIIFSEKYGAVAALKNAPHVTLIPPFHCTDEEFTLLVDNLQVIVNDQARIDMRLSGFDAFKKNEVIFINVKDSRELMKFQKFVEEQLQLLFPEKSISSSRPYHPHFTIGYRDIRHHFKQAEAEYRERTFEETFLVDKVYLWKHIDKRWAIVHSFLLNQQRISYGND